MRKLIAAGVVLLLMGIFASTGNATPLYSTGSGLKQALPQSGVIKAWNRGRHYGWYRGRHYGWYRRP
jgi:hypothetical protein